MSANRGLLNVWLVTLGFVALGGCGGGGEGPYITRVEADRAVDLSGYWNDTDSRLVSEEMIRDLMARPWTDEFRTATGNKPSLVVGRVLNKTMEHIPTETFIKDLEREIINAGEIKVVASSSQRDSLGNEKLYQSKNASLETQKAMGKELGADFLLLGQINAIEDRAGGTIMKYYQVELELINIESGEKVWIGQKKIKKVLERDQWS
jgi:uncharacterized protein (TIGR02722 family)